jgi:hypothetical protein
LGLVDSKIAGLLDPPSPRPEITPVMDSVAAGGGSAVAYGIVRDDLES